MSSPPGTDVDVVILSWNRVEETILCLESVRSQVGVDFHVWLIDQGSEPSGLQRLREFVAGASDVTVIENGRNLGVPGGRNIGMQAGSAEFIVAVDNDAEFAHPDALALVVKRMRDEPEVAVSGFRILTPQYETDHNWSYPEALRSRADDEFYAIRFVGGGHAMRRSAVEEVGWYDDRLFFSWEETELSYKLINAGHRIIYHGDVKVIHRITDEARVNWKSERYFYHVRNSLFVDFTFHRSVPRLIARAGGYVVRGLINRVPGQTVRGLWGFVTLWRTDPPQPRSLILTPEARDYIHMHDGVHQPNRVRWVLSKLLGRFHTD